MESSIYSADDQRKDTPTPSSPSDDDELDDLAPAPRTPAISRGRSGSLGGYAYRNNLLSLAASAESPTNHFSSAALESSHSNSIFQLNAFNGAALTVGVQIGAGIFSSPGVVLAEVANPGPALLVWAGSGFLAWTGAASFAELGAAIPLNGGPQSYLLYAFSPLVAFLFSWSSITVLKVGFKLPLLSSVAPLIVQHSQGVQVPSP